MRSSRIFAYSCAALGGFAILVLELLGTRLLRPGFGGGIDVWAAMISVTLLALSMGYAHGGFLAGRVEEEDWLASSFLFAAFFSGEDFLGVLVVTRGDDAIGDLRLDQSGERGVNGLADCDKVAEGRAAV